MSFGERIVLSIVTEETALNRCVRLRGLSERLDAYLDEAERAALLAEVSAATGKPVTRLLDAFLFLLPVDQRVIVGWREDEPTFKLVPYGTKTP
jgi:hypothetical protein